MYLNSRMAGIYLHIPFCKRRCIYCDFYSTTQSEKQSAYVDALCLELEGQQDYLQQAPVHTVYFGGGTPSQLSVVEFRQIFDTLYRLFEIAPQAEITIEVNPDDITPAYIEALRTLPFNRISMGVQTFHDDLLQALHRRHSAQQAIEAYHRLQEAGYQDISIDLIYGLPHETPAMWEEDLRQAVALRPTHLSAYHLIYEEGTPLWRYREQGRVKEVDEEMSNTFFRTLIRRLSDAGYEQYEISNFSLPHYHSLHNSNYWAGVPYLGVGASAHSFNGHSRQWNVADLDVYIANVMAGKPTFEVETLSTETRYNERIITAIRTMKGLYLPALKADFGEEFYRYCLRMAQPYVERSLLLLTDDHLRLSTEGIFLSDGIMSDLLWI